MSVDFERLLNLNVPQFLDIVHSLEMPEESKLINKVGFFPYNILNKMPWV